MPDQGGYWAIDSIPSDPGFNSRRFKEYLDVAEIKKTFSEKAPAATANINLTIG